MEIQMAYPMMRTSLLEDMFNDFTPGYLVRPLHGDNLPAPSQIKIDVTESGNAYTVAAEIPGVSKADIQVSVDGAVVSLQAEIKQEDRASDGEKALRSERYYGAVSRSFQLPQEVDEAHSKAKYENGILVLTLPKKQTVAAQRLTIE